MARLFVNIADRHNKNKREYNFATHILSSSYDNTIRIWDLTTKEELFCFKGHNDYITQLILFKDNTKAISVSDDGKLIIWNLLNGELITFLSFNRAISKISLTFDEKQIIVGERNGQIHFIKIEESKKPILRIVHHSH